MTKTPFPIDSQKKPKKIKLSFQKIKSLLQSLFSTLVLSLKQWWNVFPFLFLGLLGVAVFVVFPLIKGIYMSFFEYNVLLPKESTFVGLDNYIRAIHDEKVFLALRNTLLYSIITVPGQWVFGIFIATLINAKFIKHKVFFRTVYYIPVITSWVVVSFLFKYLFADGKYGLINFLLYEKLHLLSHPISWLQNEWTAMIVIWTLGIWKGIGWVMVIYLAALQSIPRHFYEAAEIDGAKAGEVFRYITLPLLKPTTIFVIINLIIGSFNVFIQVLLITNGGPLGRTEVLLSYMYKQAFSFFDFGYASAISVLMGIMIFLITWGQQKTIGKEKIEF
ncbi:carbohydrate ABC transporter permease [Tepidibacillus infernus]